LVGSCSPQERRRLPLSQSEKKVASECAIIEKHKMWRPPHNPTKEQLVQDLNEE
jgi:hypothetical protein